MNPSPLSPAGPSFAARKRWCALLLLAAVFLAYLPAFRGAFIWDDDSHLTENRCVTGPLGLAGIWTSGEAQYYPLAVTNLWLQFKLWGLHPLPYHVVTVLLHAAAALVLWRVLARLRVPGAWLGALLWALHPVQAEAVAWISETNSTQSALFFLLAVLFFLKWVEPPSGERGRLRDYALSFGFAVLAVLSKSSTVMLPVALGLCAWWLGRWRWRDLPWLAPFFLVSAAFAAWTIWEQKYHSGAMGADWNQSVPQRLIVSGRAIWFYLGKLAWPHPLIFMYPRWSVDASRWAGYLPGAAAALALALLWSGRRGGLRPVFFAYACYLVLLFPVMGFFSVFYFKYSFVADHFQYLAGMGPLALAGAALAWVGRRARIAGRALAAVLPLGLGAMTWEHCGVFHDDETLYHSVLALNPDSWLAHNNLGLILAERPGGLPAALAEYGACLRLNPGYPEAHNNLGNALMRFPGHRAEAIAHYEEALRSKPSFPEAHLDLGNALASDPNRRAEAMAQFEAALQIDPDLAKAHNSLGNILSEIPGREPEAIAEYEAALRIDSNYAESHYDFGLLLARLKRSTEAVRHFEAALRIRPDYAEAECDLANACLNLPDRRSDAIAHYEAALRIRPDYLEAHYNLGITLARLPDRREDAVAQFEEALRLRPGFEPALHALARLRGADQ